MFQKNVSLNLFADKIKSTVAYKTLVLVIVSKDELPNSKVCIKTESI